jgi:Rrf2 family protein
VNNSRYTVALHILSILGMGLEGAITSDYIAQSVNTNSVVIRRILGTLRQAGMVISRSGVGGGVELNRSPENITLLDVYRLFKQDDLFPMHSNPPNQLCPCGSNIQAVLRAVYDDAETAMEAVLEQKTLADTVAEIRQKHHEKMSG